MLYCGQRIPNRHFLQEPVTKIIKYRDVVSERSSQNGFWRFECSNFTSKNVIIVVPVVVKRIKTFDNIFYLYSCLCGVRQSMDGFEARTSHAASNDLDE